MTKNRTLKGFSLLTTLLLLTSCNLFSLSFSPYLYEDTFASSSELNPSAYVPLSYNKRYFDVTRSNPTFGFRTLTLDSLGEQKLLVLPIYFSDYSLDKLDDANGTKAHIELQNAFFGTPSTTMWESVASYYYKSSYGKLQMKGEVAPWFESSQYTVASINETMNQGYDKQTVTGNLLREAIANFSQQFPDKIGEYDQDQDGYVDAAYLVYAYPYSNSRDLGTRNIFWAYATFEDKGGNTGTGPFGHNYAWSSYYFTKSHQAFFPQMPDAHTFIHEVAHLFGIPDYYNVNIDDVDNPLGGFDMMDYTLGDHSALTKLLMEWTYPQLPTQAGKITLRSFTETGDLLLIPSVWHGNILDEYLLLEFYTPTGLNQFDSRLNHQFKLPNRAGLKVYHVDARTVYEIRLPNQFREYYYANDYQGPTAGLYELLAHTNSTGRQYQGKKPEYKIYTLLEKNGENTFQTGAKASENTLFYHHDSFGFTSFDDFLFNQGMAPEYNFKITDLNNQAITIEFSTKTS